MNDKMEKRLAGHLLHHKEHGYSVLYILRKSATRYLMFVVFFALGIVLSRYGFIAGGFFLFLTATFVGAVARDIGWLRQSKKIWPLYEKVIDWAKVKEIADKKTANNTSDGIRQPADGSPKPSM